MKEIQKTKKLEVAQHYLLGYTYGEIEKETGVSHGSIANIIKEIENGKLTIPGTAFDQVTDLRQLSFDLKKKVLEPSQALLGLSAFERLQDLEITPELLDKWADLTKIFAPVNFPAKDFFKAALRLHELERSEGKSFDGLAGGFILGVLITKDKFAAWNAGLSGFDGIVQGFGHAKWVVSLGKKIGVAPSENISLEGKWIDWESLKSVIGELRDRALN